MKLCRKCGKIKPIAEFNRRTLAKDGAQSYCRECQHIYPIERCAYIDGHFEVRVLPSGVKCYKVRPEFC